jgi:hypothetical protein
MESFSMRVSASAVAVVIEFSSVCDSFDEAYPGERRLRQGRERFSRLIMSSSVCAT